MMQSRRTLVKPPERTDIKPEKQTCNRIVLDELEAGFVQYCQVDLCLDEVAKRDAKRLFDETKSLLFASIGTFGSGTEDEIGRLWSACVLYCSLKLNSHIYPNGERERPVCSATTKFTLSQLLRTTKLGVWDFFRELPQFLQKADSILRNSYGGAYEHLCQQVKDMQANFVHLTVLFNYYKRNFQKYFLSEEDVKEESSSVNASGPKHLRFGWMLFLALRMHVLSQFTDLVTCTNSLIAVLVIMIIHMPVHLRNFSLDDGEIFAIRGPDGVNVIASFCNLYNASEEDVWAMVGKANDTISQILQVIHDLNTEGHVERLKGFDTGGMTIFKDLLESCSLDCYLNILDKDYEEMHYKQGELDERIFLSEDNSIHDNISDSSVVSAGMSSVPTIKRKHGAISSISKSAFVRSGPVLSPPASLCPSPMKVVGTRMLPPTPVTVTMTTAKWLRTVIAPLSPEPSSELMHFFRSCDTDITKEVMHRAQALLESIFPSEVYGSWGFVGGSQGNGLMDSVWSKQRRLEALKLYYRVLGAMCRAESHRLQCNNLTALLTNERFHHCMLACSAELVLATHKTVTMNFPSVLEPAGITAFDLSKVIESFVRHEETLPRELKRHLNSIEEKLLEKLAWEKGSSMYNSLIVARPNLQLEINRLGLLADPMPSLDTLSPCHHPGNAQLQSSTPRSEMLSGESNDQSPQSQGNSLLQGITVSTLVDQTSAPLVFPIRDRQSALPSFTSVKFRGQPPLQSAFASPRKASPTGGGETCAETVINVFLQKVLKLAALRIKALCESLKQPNCVMEEIYRMVQHIVQQETSLLFNRHIDQIILCSIYGVCKVNRLNLTFKEIVQHYRAQPHSKPDVFRTVFIDLPAAKQTGKGQETVDIIKFYNEVFVPSTKSFLMQLSSNVTHAVPSTRIADDGDRIDGQLPGSPGPSPFPSLPDMSPKKVSANHNVYVSPLRSSKMESLLSPHSRSLYACVGESTHAYQSPSKDLKEINKRVNNRRLGKLDFGDAGLVSDSLVAGSLYPTQEPVNEVSVNLTSDSVLSQSQSLSCSNSTPPHPSPSKYPHPDR
eukprot:c29235_g1_i5 orf=213-3407(+)